MGDIDEVKQMLREAVFKCIHHKGHTREEIATDIKDALALLDNMEEPITERFQIEIDKYNEMIVLLKEMKDMIEEIPTEKPEKDGCGYIACLDPNCNGHHEVPKEEK